MSGLENLYLCLVASFLVPFLFFFKKKNYLFLAVPCLHCFLGFSVGAAHGLLIMVTSLAEEDGLQAAWASVIVTPGL